MKKLIFTATMLFGLMAQAATYKLDPVHSEVGFVVKHLVVSNVRGTFDKYEGTFDFDDKTNELSKVDVKIDASSINTRDKKRDDHLRSPDFFDVKKKGSENLIFKVSQPVKVTKDQTVKVTGDLTMRGVTKPVTLDLTYGGMATDGYGNEKVGFSMRGKVNRKDWGINWNKNLDRGGVTVSDEVTIEIDGQGVKQKR